VLVCVCVYVCVSTCLSPHGLISHSVRSPFKDRDCTPAEKTMCVYEFECVCVRVCVCVWVCVCVCVWVCVGERVECYRGEIKVWVVLGSARLDRYRLSVMGLMLIR